MANELLSPTVAFGCGIIAVGGISFAAGRIRDMADSHLIPLMGVLGAFVFAAQMVNFSLPAIAGTSDHLIGAILLAVLLGPHAALITMTGILVVQCLVFQDGGLLALGANIINMGLLPAYIGYGLWRLMIGQGPLTRGKLLPAAWTAAFIGVCLGSAAVCVEVGLSGRLAIPLAKFSAAMIGIHLVSGAIEGGITCAILIFLYKLYPHLAGTSVNWQEKKMNPRSLVVMICVLAVVTAGSFSWFASPYADGLERVVSAPSTLKPKTELAGKIDTFQNKFTPLPDYNKRDEPSQKRWPNVNFWTSFSGLLGIGLTMFVIRLGAGFITCRQKVKSG
ncbi:MAG: energy-coupling factor ABC transporter permease [Phycisphaerae bacterium]